MPSVSCYTAYSTTPGPIPVTLSNSCPFLKLAPVGTILFLRSNLAQQAKVQTILFLALRHAARQTTPCPPTDVPLGSHKQKELVLSHHYRAVVRLQAGSIGFACWWGKRHIPCRWWWTRLDETWWNDIRMSTRQRPSLLLRWDTGRKGAQNLGEFQLMYIIPSSWYEIPWFI